MYHGFYKRMKSSPQKNWNIWSKEQKLFILNNLPCYVVKESSMNSYEPFFSNKSKTLFVKNETLEKIFWFFCLENS